MSKREGFVPKWISMSHLNVFSAKNSFSLLFCFINVSLSPAYILASLILPGSSHVTEVNTSLLHNMFYHLDTIIITYKRKCGIRYQRIIILTKQGRIPRARVKWISVFEAKEKLDIFGIKGPIVKPSSFLCNKQYSVNLVYFFLVHTVHLFNYDSTNLLNITS